MRKLKFKKEPLDQETKEKGIKLVILGVLMNSFAKLLYWNKDFKKDVNQIGILLDMCESKTKIVFQEKEVFNDYPTSPLIKRWSKLYKDAETNVSNKVRLIFEEFLQDYMQRVEKDTVDNYMKYYRTATMHDIYEIKEMVKDVVRIGICFNNYKVAIQGKETKEEKTLLTLANTWLGKIHKDILGG
ncbi:hypothetical protein [Streptobacillus canis]|uniref:hypothetical protein n=1 Tax=Streptobacillus canis TaxID=2678686 RepID=UPI0012E17734|nr:hypothetical protein [Streptobacillus canis]